MMIKFKQGISELAHIYENVVIEEGVTVFPGAVLGRPPLSSGAARKVEVSEIGPLIIRAGSVIGANAVIYAGSIIGENSMVCDGACIRENVIIGNNSLIAMGVTVNRDVVIGNHVKIMDNSHVTGNAIIEDGVFIGPLVTMANDNSMNRSGAQMESMLGPKIRKNSRIGQGACLLPGVEIGEESLVGANSVVTKSVPPFSKVKGVPARIINE